MDRVKPVERLIAAYDDPEGVTAAFNLNLLERINRELDGDMPVDAFRHEARWNDILSRIEMHLVATRDVEFSDRRASASTSPQGSSIHTENSHKYGQRGARVLLLAGGWTPVAEWTDPAGDFAVILAEAAARAFRALIAGQRRRLSRGHDHALFEIADLPARASCCGSSSSR